MDDDIVQVDDDLTVPPVDDGEHGALKVRRRVHQSKLKPLATKRPILRHEPAELYAIIAHRHVMETGLDVKGTKARRPLQTSQAILQVRSREAINLGALVNSPEVGAQAICLARLRWPIRPASHQHNPVQTRIRRSPTDHTLTKQRISLLPNPLALLGRILNRPLPDHRPLLDLHAKRMVGHVPNVVLRRRKTTLQVCQLAKIPPRVIPRAVTQLHTTKHIERTLPRLIGRGLVKQIMLNQPGIPILRRHLPRQLHCCRHKSRNVTCCPRGNARIRQLSHWMPRTLCDENATWRGCSAAPASQSRGTPSG